MAESKIRRVPAATPKQAAAHFGARLAFYTDAWDLHEDLLGEIPNIHVIDARKAESYAAGHIPGAVNIHYADITAARMSEFDKRHLYVVYCTSVACNASTRAAFRLSRLGFRVKELLDGLHAWEADKFPVAKGAEAGVLKK